METSTIIRALVQAGFKAEPSTSVPNAIAVYRDRHWSYLTKRQAISLLQPWRPSDERQTTLHR